MPWSPEDQLGELVKPVLDGVSPGAFSEAKKMPKPARTTVDCVIRYARPRRGPQPVALFQRLRRFSRPGPKPRNRSAPGYPSAAGFGSVGSKYDIRSCFS